MPTKRALLILAILAICTNGWSAEKTDRGKLDIELPTKFVINNSASLPGAPNLPTKLSAPARPKRDFGKGRIESPTERLLVERANAVFHPEPETRSRATASENPKVAPGKVRWHANFAAACAASRTSRKPVLLFQMMGNLDDRFC